MDKVRKLISVGAVYLLFIFGFTFFDTFSFVKQFLIKVGIRGGGTEVVKPFVPTDMDPCPPPPFPPPGGGDG